MILKVKSILYILYLEIGLSSVIGRQVINIYINFTWALLYEFNLFNNIIIPK